MTATPATNATQEVGNPASVASVATVAVAATQKPPPELSPDEQFCIRAWLEHIDETDSASIDDVVDKCFDDLDARRYFLKRSLEVPEPSSTYRSSTCGNCTHFERIDHPHLGHCTVDEPEAIAGLWDTDRHYCEHHSPRPAHTNADQSSPARAETKGEFPK